MKIEMIMKVLDGKITAEATAGTEKAILTFSERKDSDSVIATLPKAFQALGTATNITIKRGDIEDGKVITRDSVKGVKSTSSHAKVSGYNRRVFIEGDDDSITVYTSAPNGDKVHPLTIKDKATAKAWALARAFTHFESRLTADYEKALGIASNATIKAEMKALLLSTGMTEADADKAIDKKYGLHAKAFNLADEMALMEAEAKAKAETSK